MMLVCLWKIFTTRDWRMIYVCLMPILVYYTNEIDILCCVFIQIEIYAVWLHFKHFCIYIVAVSFRLPMILLFSSFLFIISKFYISTIIVKIQLNDNKFKNINLLFTTQYKLFTYQVMSCHIHDCYSVIVDSRYTMGMGVKIPWIGIKIPWVGGSKYHG